MAVISIGVVVRDHPECVRETLASLSANTGQPFDLLLLGDGPDHSALALLSELRAVPSSTTATALGNAACFNRLVAHKSSDFYLLLEGGVQVSEGWLSRLLTALQRYPKCGLAGPSTNRATNVQGIVPDAPNSAEEIRRIASTCERRFGPSCRSLEPLYSLGDFCYLVRGDVVDAIGRADESYGIGQCWELEYNLRAARAGFQGLWACSAYVHRAASSQRQLREEAQRLASRKQIYRERCYGAQPRSFKATTAGVNVQETVLPRAVNPPPPAPSLIREVSSKGGTAAKAEALRSKGTVQLPKELREFKDYHRGASMVVCGCGTSLRTFGSAGRFLTIGVNDVGRQFHPDYLVVVNPRAQFQGDRFRYVEESRAGAIFTQLDLNLPHHRVIRFALGRRGGVDFSNLDLLNYTNNSPYIALCLAVHMGASRVGIIGVDFTDDHFFAPTGRHPLEPQLLRINAEYKRLYDECVRRGVEVFNLSSDSRLTAFPKLSLSQFERAANPAKSLQVVSYATTPIAGVPAVLARCISARTIHRGRTVWATKTYANGVSFDGDVEWESAPSEAEELLRSADVVIAHNGKIDSRHRSLLTDKPVVTLAHNYKWNVDCSFVERGYPGLVVGQYQATLPEFRGWFSVPNPMPLWEEAFRPGPKPPEITICYTPSGKHETYPAGHQLYWHSKGYETTMRVLERLAQRFPIRLEVIRAGQVKHAESLAMKRKAHIVIDECVTGSYHRNSLEGLALGCVVVNGMGLLPAVAEVFRRCSGNASESPFVFATLDTLEQALVSLVEMGPAALECRGAGNRAWMERHWDFQQQWEEFWDPVIAIPPHRHAVKEVKTVAPLSSMGTTCMNREVAEQQLKQGLSVVVCHGGRERLPHLSASLTDLRQCEGVDEVLVVEMGPSAYAMDLARKWADKYAFLRNDEVFERARSLNTGTALTEYDLVFWKGNDLLVPADFISRAISEMRARNLDYLMPHSRIHYLSESDSHRVRQGIRNPADCTPTKVFRPVRENSGAAGIVRRSFILKYGGMQESFRGWGGEDDAWWYKAQLLGNAGITQRQDQTLYHLFHAHSGANGDNSQISGNPHYSQNVAILKDIRSVRDRNTFCEKFPCPEFLAGSWKGKRLLWLLPSTWEEPQSPVGELSKILEALFGIVTELRLVGTLGAREILSEQSPDAILVSGAHLAKAFLSDEALAPWWSKTILTCLGKEQEDAIAGLVERAGAILTSAPVACAQSGLRSRIWKGVEPGEGTPLSVAISLLQPFSVIVGGGGHTTPHQRYETKSDGHISELSSKRLPVWMYWEGECPDWIQQCQQTVHTHASEVRLLNPETFDKLQDADRDIDLNKLHVAHRADYIRAFLLARFGGLWVDSDCLVMGPLDPILDKLNHYDFIAHRERSGLVSNGFLGSRPGGRVASELYRRVCETLRSRRSLGWTSLGSEPLTDILKSNSDGWHELECCSIQPICWSNPGAFFAIGSVADHERAFDSTAVCYMLSNTEVKKYANSHPESRLLAPQTFFSYLLAKALTDKVEPAAEEISVKVPNGWQQIPFVTEALTALSPRRVLDVQVGHGRWGLLLREFWEQSNGNGFSKDAVRLVGLASAENKFAAHHPYLYDHLHTESQDLAQLLAEPWDLVLLGDGPQDCNESNPGQLDRSLAASEYVLLITGNTSNGGNSWPLGELMRRDPVRLAMYPRADGHQDAAFLFSRLDPKKLRGIGEMEEVFRRHADQYVQLGDESMSGPGSTLVSTVEVRRRLPLLLEDLGVQSLLDAPCGDFNWMRRVRLGIERYTGVDVMREVIQNNQTGFGDATHTFISLDIRRNALPQTDLILCRDCLVHFSYDDIFRTLQNFSRSKSKYLLTTTFPSVQENTDIASGDWRPLNLQKPPFRMPEPLRLINEKCTENGGRYSDKSLGLWELRWVV